MSYPPPYTPSLLTPYTPLEVGPLAIPAVYYDYRELH